MAIITTPLRSILIANRSEIAIRVMRAASEMRIRTMKMETHGAAARAAEVEAVPVAPGGRVQAKDLLILLRLIG